MELNVMKLRYLADLRTLAFVTTYFGLVIGQWIYPPDQTWLAVLLVLATCVFSFFGAVITHNTIHCPVFVKRRVNQVFQVILSLTYGSPVSAFVPGHNLSHHKHTQTKRDVMRTTKVRHGLNILNMLEFAPRVALSIMRNDAAYVSAMKGTHRRWFLQYRIESAVVLSVTIGLLILDWKKALLYWLLPHLYAAWGIISINYLQHDGCDMNSRYNHSRNFVGRFVNWWTFNNGFHGIHHEQPGLHWSLTPQAHYAYFSDKIDPRLEQKSMLLFLLKTFVFPGVRSTFDGKPVQLPPASKDENWIPRPEETPEDLGAVAPS
jgi:fatty acid desaturase